MSIQSETIDKLIEAQVEIAANLQNLLLARSHGVIYPKETDSTEAIAKALYFVLKSIQDLSNDTDIESQQMQAELFSGNGTDLLAFFETLQTAWS